MTMLQKCPKCNKQFKVPAEYLGKQTKCTGCGEDFTIKKHIASIPKTELPTLKGDSVEVLKSIDKTLMDLRHDLFKSFNKQVGLGMGLGIGIILAPIALIIILTIISLSIGILGA